MIPDPDSPPPPDRPSLALGTALVAFGAMAAFLAARIPYRPLGDTSDPGPRAFPLLLGLFLAAGGLRELIELREAQRAAAARGEPNPFLPNPRSLFPPRATLSVGLAAILYVPAIAWLGFIPSTILLVLGLMKGLGATWRWAVGTAITLVAVIHLLFATLFRVQLPTGLLGFPW
ncbi:MAG: tripartite tricarboxylate transporter TctB family protein [Verrucomicrobiae bacterium]|nr:tripartite tricarboxylate transporter TctB family protein [Verrucomicrobiae bacterium]